MTRIWLGYACINLTLGHKARTSRTCRIFNATSQRLEELARANLKGLSEVLRWNVSQNIKVFRISSEIIPLASHPKAQWSWQRVLRREIATIGSFAKEHHLRLSMHPGQYTVLNSPRMDVVAAANVELCYHADFLDAMGLTSEHKIIIHVGGVYGNREVSLRRFCENYRSLSSNVRNRLVIENDERSYNVDDVLNLSALLKVPIVFDYLHCKAFSKRPLRTSLLDKVCATWSASDGRPEFHYSTQKNRARRGAHADMIDPNDFKRFLRVLPQTDIDVMLEAKAKDKALLQLRRDLQSRRGVRNIVIE
jgi:UV DNA damage endonuclease